MAAEQQARTTAYAFEAPGMSQLLHEDTSSTGTMFIATARPSSTPRLISELRDEADQRVSEKLSV